jgi:divalent metal cation (Fe/Co/Zn/Cd) transporter
MAEDHHIIPVWFFVGVILSIYGVLIFVTGIYGLFHPPSTVLANLHAGVWWGALLMIVGGVYVYLFLPRKS